MGNEYAKRFLTAQQGDFGLKRIIHKDML